MAADAGTFLWTFPVSGSTTEATGANVALTPTGLKCAFIAALPTDVYEVGVVIGTTTTAGAFAFTVAVDNAIGGTLANGSVPANSENFCTVTGPAVSVAAGLIVKKEVRFRIPKGGTLQFNVTTANAAGTGMFYAVCATAGDIGSYTAGALVGSQAGAGGVGIQSPPVPNQYISTT